VEGRPCVQWCSASASILKGCQVRALPRSGWAAVGMLLFASAACGVAGPSPTGTPAPSNGLPPTVVAAEPTETSAVELPAPNKPTATVQRPAHKEPSAIVPRPDHIVVVILENEHRSSVITHAPYLKRLAAKGANLTHSYGVTHPSQPNYLALFSGSTHGVRSNACPKQFRKANNLGHQLRQSGLSFIGYSESLPKTGFRGCASGRYLRKHNPWVNFATLPADVNRPFTAFPRDYSKLPTVSFVSPNMCHGMHDCSVRTGDRWMKKHIDRYARWAPRHNSLLIVTFDENAGGKVKPIFTIIVGAKVRPGVYAERLNHYKLLRTIEESYGLPPLGHAKGVRPLSTIWTS